MNQAMWLNAATQDNLALLRQRGMQVFGPGAGEQACGDVGPGRMLEPGQLLEMAAAIFDSGMLAGLRFVITAGPTQEAIDPVRYISNHSSGKMAYALAAEAAAAGATVTLVSGPVALPTPDRVQRINVISAQNMLDAVMTQVGDCDVFIGVAAVADYRPVEVSAQKLKKSSESMTVQLTRNPDIVATVAALEAQMRPFTVGFAAETENIEAFARDKRERKKLDLLFANDAVATMGSDAIQATALWAEGQAALGPGSKSAIARQMLTLIREHLDAHCATPT